MDMVCFDVPVNLSFYFCYSHREIFAMHISCRKTMKLQAPMLKEIGKRNVRNRQQTTLTGHPSQEVQSTIILIFYPNWCRCLHRTHGAQEPVCLSVGAARLVRVFCLISAGLQSPAWLATVSWDVCFADWSTLSQQE